MKNKKRGKKILIISIGLLIIIGIILTIFFSGFFIPKKQITIENPLKDIVLRNTNENGEVNIDKVIEEGVIEFNENYINYILIALGVNNLHKSLIGYGNPIVEFSLDGELWTSEIIRGGLNTVKSPAEKKDLLITMSKKEAVKALLSQEITTFMKESVMNGNTKIERIAGEIELGSKGYLSMYQELTSDQLHPK